jgi:hypothetical protein
VFFLHSSKKKDAILRGAFYEVNITLITKDSTRKKRSIAPRNI